MQNCVTTTYMLSRQDDMSVLMNRGNQQQLCISTVSIIDQELGEGIAIQESESHKAHKTFSMNKNILEDDSHQFGVLIEKAVS